MKLTEHELLKVDYHRSAVIGGIAAHTTITTTITIDGGIDLDLTKPIYITQEAEDR